MNGGGEPQGGGGGGVSNGGQAFDNPAFSSDKEAYPPPDYGEEVPAAAVYKNGGQYTPVHVHVCFLQTQVS